MVKLMIVPPRGDVLHSPLALVKRESESLIITYCGIEKGSAGAADPVTHARYQPGTNHNTKRFEKVSKKVFDVSR